MYTLGVNKVFLFKSTAPVTAFTPFFLPYIVLTIWLSSFCIVRWCLCRQITTFYNRGRLFLIDVPWSPRRPNWGKCESLPPSHPTLDPIFFLKCHLSCFPVVSESDALCSISVCKGQNCRGVERVPPLTFQCSLFIFWFLLILAYPLKLMELGLVF